MNYFGLVGLGTWIINDNNNDITNEFWLSRFKSGLDVGRQVSQRAFLPHGHEKTEITE